MSKIEEKDKKSTISAIKIKKLVQLVVENELDLLAIGDIKIVKSRHAMPEFKIPEKDKKLSDQELRDYILFNGGAKH